jgi:hypothetical protein
MRSYAMTVSETISESHAVLHAISSLASSNAEIARTEGDFIVRVVLLKCTRLLHCTE